MKQGSRDISLAEALHKCGWIAKTKVQRAVEYLKIDFENGSPADILSATNFPVTGEGQDVIITDARGYEYITNIISKPFQEKIMLNKQVTKVVKKDQHYMVETSDKHVFRSKFVMVTVSKTVLESHQIHFYPPLPEWKLESLTKIVTGHYCKVFVNYPTKFWEDTNYIMIGQNKKSFIHWQNLNRVYPGHNILMTTLTGEECRESELLSNDEVVAMVQTVLQSVYGTISQPSGNFVPSFVFSCALIKLFYFFSSEH